MFGRLIGFLSSLRNFLRHLKDTILGHLIRDIWREAMKIKLKLHQVLDPVLATIKRIRAIQQYYFDHLLKPYLDLIQRIRRVLVVFRLLHFRWADALDKYLVEREVQIQKLFLEARRDLNTLADWINFIVDPFHLINHNLFLGSAIRSAKELYAIVFGAQRGSLSPAQAKEQTADAHRFDRQNVIAELHERAQLGLLPGDQEEQLRIKAAFAARGY
jgi:hypothetical protein